MSSSIHTVSMQSDKFSSSRGYARGLFILALFVLVVVRNDEVRALTPFVDNKITVDTTTSQQDLHSNLKIASDPIMLANMTDFELAFTESLGFFTDIPNNLWLSRKAISRNRIHNSDGKKNRMNTIGTYYQMNWDPDFACFLEDSIGGKYGDGHKWICDPHRLASQPDCLIYSIGSNAQFEFEAHLSQIAPNCEIHIFDPDDYSKDLAKLSMKNTTYHTWGLKASSSSDPTKSNQLGKSFQPKKKKGLFFQSATYRTLSETMDILGHQGRRIDILKIDCEGCEWVLYNDLLQQDLRQIVIEVHWFNKNTNKFFRDLSNEGYVIFHKEPNIQWAFGKCVEFSFLKLSKQFFQ